MAPCRALARGPRSARGRLLLPFSKRGRLLLHAIPALKALGRCTYITTWRRMDRRGIMRRREKKKKKKKSTSAPYLAPHTRQADHAIARLHTYLSHATAASYLLPLPTFLSHMQPSLYKTRRYRNVTVQALCHIFSIFNTAHVAMNDCFMAAGTPFPAINGTYFDDACHHRRAGSAAGQNAQPPHSSQFLLLLFKHIAFTNKKFGIP